MLTSRRSAAAAVALLMAATLAILAHEATERELLPGDHTLQQSLKAWRQPEFDASMRAVSMLGSGYLLAPLNVLVALLLWRRGYRKPLLIGALTFGAVAAEVILKWLVHRPRPKDVGYGFPSGHVMVSVVFFGLVLYLLWEARRGDAAAWLATAVGVVAVAAIGVSRVYLNAHWLSDVLGATAGGLAFLIFAILRLGPHLCARGDPPPLRIVGARWSSALAVTGAAVLGLVDVGARTLTNNDEARFPVLAQFILSGGDWLVPSLNGAPYVNKPPLLAWAIAAASWPAGRVTQLTAVIPCVLAGVITVIVVYRLGRELWNPTTGRYAAAVAATTQGLFVYSRIPMPDMLLTAFGALSLWALHRMRRRRPGLAWLAFYAALAGGFWTKGPAGLLPLAVALGYALLRRRVEPLGWLRLVPGLLVLGALLAPWSLAAALREADATHRTVAVDYLLWYVPQHLSIMTLLTPLEHVISVMLPWAWLAPFALYDAWRVRRGRGAERDAVVLVLVWSGAVFVMLALSHQQRVRYYVPLVPPLSLLLGWWLGAAVVQRRKLSLWRVRWTAALLGAGAAVAGLWFAAQGRVPSDLSTLVPTSAVQSLVILIAGVAVVLVMELALRGERVRRALPVAVVAAGVFLVALNHAEQQRRNTSEDYPAVARLAAELRGADEQVAALGIPVLPVAFYLGAPVKELAPELVTGSDWAEPGTIVIADVTALDGGAASIALARETTLGRQRVMIGTVTGPLPPLPGTIARTRTPSPTAPGVDHIRHLAFELLCVLIALAAVVGRSSALRRGTPTTVYAAEAVIILALASFPAHPWVFVAGVGAAASWAYSRWRGPVLSDRPHAWVAVLLMVPLPLDFLEDVLDGDPVQVDPIWLISLLLGIVLLTWRRMRPAAL